MGDWTKCKKAGKRAEKLAKKGRVNEAVQAYIEAGRPSEAGNLLAGNGRFVEAAKLYEEADNSLYALEFLLERGLEVEALQVTPRLPKHGFERPEFDSEWSRVWCKHIERLLESGRISDALHWTLEAGKARHLKDVYWGMICDDLRGRATTQQEREYWADITCECRARASDEGKPMERYDWETALACYSAGRREDAFILFNSRLFRPVVDPSRSEIAGGLKVPNDKLWMMFVYDLEYCPHEPDADAYSGLLNYALDRYLQNEKTTRQAWHLVWSTLSQRGAPPRLWETLAENTRHLLIRRVLKLELPLPEEFSPYDTQELKLTRINEVEGIMFAWTAYERLGTKETDIEQAIIDRAEELDRFDCVLRSLENFGRYDEALALLEETPPHILYPDAADPEHETARKQQELQFRLKRNRSSGSKQPQPPAREDLDRMLALAEITMAEYEHRVSGSNDGQAPDQK